MNIPFNKPYFTGQELENVQTCIAKGKSSGNGYFTKLCQKFFEEEYGFGKCLLTSSCTDALEMAAILLNIKPGDEVIMPSYNFMSAPNAFALRGAKIVFVDSRDDHPGIDEDLIEEKINSNTRAIVLVHYAGVACNMIKIEALVKKYGLYLVEDSAHAIDSFFIDQKGISKPLGSFGHMSTFSFHETKNIISGEGGMLVVNDPQFFDRAEIIWEKGTNRAEFQRGTLAKYEWIDIGSSFLPSEFTAAILYAQLIRIKEIQKKRLEIWNFYLHEISSFSSQNLVLPSIPTYSTNNAHIFYVILNSIQQRQDLIKHLLSEGISAVFHYQSLHKSPYSRKNFESYGMDLKCSDLYSDVLLRLPLYYELSPSEQDFIIDKLKSFFK